MDTFKAVLSFIYFGCSEGIHFLILNHFSQLLFHVTGTLPWVLKSTSPKVFPNYFIVAYFYPIFPLVSTISEANNGTLAFTFQYLVTYGTPCHAMPVVTRCFPTSFPGRQKLSSGVTSILSTCRRSHTSFTCNQFN